MVADVVSVAPDGSGQQVGYIPLEKIRGLDERPQVRRDWRHDDGAQKLDDLAASLRTHGMLTPVELERCADGTYAVLIGHRRIVAARRAGLTDVPALIRTADERERCVLQLVENIHRHDLAPLDKAHAFASLCQDHGWSKARLAQEIGLSTETVVRYLDLLDDPVICEAIRSGVIAPSIAQQVRDLVPPYDQDIRARLAQGERITGDDVAQARTGQRAAQVLHPADPRARTQASAPQREQVLALHQEGLTASAITGRLGISRAQVYRWLRQAGVAPRGEGGQPLTLAPTAGQREARRLRDQGLTFKEIGHKLGGISAAAAKMRCDATQAPTRAHERTPKSALPWENQDSDPTEPAPWPALPADEGRTMASATPYMSGAAQTACAAPLPVPVHDPLGRLRGILVGTEQPCMDLLHAVVRVGREQGWSCVELWRNVQAASDLFSL